MATQPAEKQGRGNQSHLAEDGSFRSALAGESGGVLEEIVFAATDWSSERRFLGPFRDALG
jgi:hypothetical protein